jgi:hypothetical protein
MGKHAVFKQLSWGSYADALWNQPFIVHCCHVHVFNIFSPGWSTDAGSVRPSRVGSRSRFEDFTNWRWTIINKTVLQKDNVGSDVAVPFIVSQFRPWKIRTYFDHASCCVSWYPMFSFIFSPILSHIREHFFISGYGNYRTQQKHKGKEKNTD